MNPERVDVCVMLSRFSEGKIKKCIDALKASNAFTSFCKRLRLDRTVFLQILKMTFNQIEPKNIEEVFHTLGLQAYCHIGILKAIMAICKGHIHRSLYDKQPYEIATKTR